MLVNWEDFTSPKFKPTVRIQNKDKKDEYYSDVIFTFDTENTSLFNFDSGWNVFNYSLTPEDYKGIDKAAINYIWQLGVNDTVYYGRYLSDFPTFLEVLRKTFKGRIIIYVHNLAYDFEFLSGVLQFDEVFARTTRKPIKAYCKQFDVEFRCSYILSNSSLEKCSDNFGLDISKKSGDLDYDLLRTPLTPLTDVELAYCEYDILVLYKLIYQFKQRFGHIKDIPLTSTGIIRAEVRKAMCSKVNKKALEKIRECAPDYDVFVRLLRAFAGGYTHANASRVDINYNNVKSFDFASSYPAQMLMQKYPCSPFLPVTITDIDQLDNEHAYLVTVKLNNFTSVKAWNYLSESKAIEIDPNAQIDNGRVVSADYAVYTVTEQDIYTIFQNYEIDSYDIIECYVADKDYLPKCFTDIIVEHYIAKTSLKGVEGAEDKYRRAKAFINGLFGMTVTQTVRPDVVFENGVWSEAEFTEQIAREKLSQVNEKAFLNYAWGVWITAYARRALWIAILDLDNDVIYCDTDSLKVTGNIVDKYIEDYNISVHDKLCEVADERGYDFDKDFAPADPSGKQHPIGYFDYEGCYKEFKTLGAKKYACLDSKGFHVTVSGLSKKKAVEQIKSVNDFKCGVVFSYQTSGRTISHYLPRRVVDVVDYTGIPAHVESNRSICIQPTTYTLDIGDVFEEYLLYLSNKAHNFSGL